MSRRPLVADPRTGQLTKLSEIGRALTYTTSLDEVAGVTIDRGAALVDASAAVLMLADAEGQMHVRASHGIDDARVAMFQAPSTGEVVGRLQGLLNVPDEFFIAVPLVVEGAVTGLIAVALRHRGADADEWMLSALADQAAVALERARLGGEVRLEMEARLRASEGATNAKDRALATLAHDIRGPLGAIEGYCSNLEDALYGPVTPDQHQALSRVRMSGRHLLSLLENVMDMARLTTGAVTINTGPVRLSAVARDAVDILAPASMDKGQSLDIGEMADVVASADAGRLRQVLINLIGNAVKFTPTGGRITVSVTRCPQDGCSEIRISDTGPGIAEAEQIAIFEPYYRSETVALMPGVGLGLAISQALVKQMGGELIVESQAGAGATFIVRFLP